MDEPELRAELTFSDVDKAEAGRLAADLEEYLQTKGLGIETELVRDDPDAMDLGSTLVLLLGTKSAIGLAAGLATWLKMRGDPALTIKTKKGTMRIPGNLSDDDRAKIALKAIESGTI